LWGQDFFDPLNCPERSEGQFRGQKSRGPLKMSQIFLNIGTLVILCLFATMGPQFYSFLTMEKYNVLLPSQLCCSFR
jgi:hypothetical protein